MSTALFVVTTRPNDFAWSGVILEVDITELGVVGIDGHSAHGLSRTLLIVIGTPVVRSVIVHHWSHGTTNQMFARLVGKISGSGPNNRILERVRPDHGTNPRPLVESWIVSRR